MVIKATATDATKIAQLAIKLWAAHSVEELSKEYEVCLQNDKNAVFLFLIDSGIIGFAQCGLRYDYVEGTSSSPVGYLEGIFIEEAFRNRSCATELLSACEKWAREKGCEEFASDCELGNEASFAFHSKAGFSEANRIICFTKKL